MRRIIAVVLMALFVFVQPTVASAEDVVPLDGYCEDGKPVLNRPLRENEVAGCDQFGLYIEYLQDFTRAPGDLPSIDDFALEPPDLHDFAYWAYVQLNDRWEISAKANADRKEPRAFLLRGSERVVMPIRFFTEAIGGQVSYSSNGTVTLIWRGVEAVLQIGSKKATVNGSLVDLDQAPIIVWGRTMVPTRFVMETFGADVSWVSSSATVRVQLQGVECYSPDLCFDIRR